MYNNFQLSNILITYTDFPDGQISLSDRTQYLNLDLDWAKYSLLNLAIFFLKKCIEKKKKKGLRDNISYIARVVCDALWSRNVMLCATLLYILLSIHPFADITAVCIPLTGHSYKTEENSTAECLFTNV